MKRASIQFLFRISTRIAGEAGSGAVTILDLPAVKKEFGTALNFDGKEALCFNDWPKTTPVFEIFLKPPDRAPKEHRNAYHQRRGSDTPSRNPVQLRFGTERRANPIRFGRRQS